MTITLEPSWVALFITLFSIAAAGLAWYIRITVDRATATINKPNSGSHVVDRVKTLETTTGLLLSNQKLIMKANGITPLEE